MVMVERTLVNGEDMTKKLPLFVFMPRSGSSIIFEAARNYAINNLGMISLGRNSEIFNRFMVDHVSLDTLNETQKSLELFTLNNKDPKLPMTLHGVYPNIFTGPREAVIHKVRVLMKERERGFEHYIKVVASAFHQAPDEIMELYKDRKFVLIRSRNIKDSALSLVYSYYTNLWHARTSNWHKWEHAADEPVNIHTGVVANIWNEIKVYRNMDKWEHKLSERDYDYTVIYKEDLISWDHICGEIDKIYETNEWRGTLTDDTLRALPHKRKKDYKKLIKNYDQISSLIDERIKSDFKLI